MNDPVVDVSAKIVSPVNTVVGKRYRVPCVKVRRLAMSLRFRAHHWMAILGSAHEDRQHIGFPWEHWHVDHRFIDPKKHQHIEPFGLVVLVEHVIEGPVYKRLLCRRPSPTFLTTQPPRSRTPGKPIAWLPALEEAYADHRVPFEGARLSPCAVCPHRGFPLHTMQPDGDGNITCPGHGLTWNTKTGKLVRRASVAPGSNKESQ